MNPKKFVKIDLHIHTPSSKCYKGSRNSEEYFKIIEEANKKELKIIAITDHNSVDGYKKIMKYWEELVTKKDTLKKINDSRQSHKQLKEINKRISLFKDLLILPGIEFEVSNGVHLLTIFNNNTPISDIEKFLYEGGYGSENQGSENPSELSNWDIMALLDKTKKYDCIVIDAHTDSVKGVYNTINEGKLRAAVFHSDQLCGLCYNSEVTKDKIVSINSREYNRNKPLAYLKASDAHCVLDIAKDKTWFNLSEISFQSLKEAFDNPVENISTEKPEINEILKKLLKDSKTFGIQDFSDENQEYFRQLVCALHNSEGGYCLFGVNKNNNKIGLPIEDNEKETKKIIKNYLLLIIKNLNKIGSVNIKQDALNIYRLQGNKIIVSLRINSANNLLSIIDDGRIYLLKGREIKTADANEIQSLIEGRNSFLIENKIKQKIENIEKECFFVNNYFSSLPIIKKIEKKSKNIKNVIEKFEIISCCKTKKETEIKKLTDKFENGQSDGNIIFCLQRTLPRLEDGYLRISAPVIKLDHNKSLKAKETIYLFPGGAVYLSNKKYPLYTSDGMFALALRSNNKEYSNKFIVSFLKSSLLLWYCMNKFESQDIFAFKIFKDLIIPKININNPQNKKHLSQIKEIMDVIVNEEKKILINIEKIEKKPIGPAKGKELRRLVTDYNKDVGKYFYQIDKIIYNIMELTNKEVDVIEDYLKTKKIYIPI